MEIHKAFQEKFSPDVLVEKTVPLPVYYGNVCLRNPEQLFLFLPSTQKIGDIAYLPIQKITIVSDSDRNQVSP